MTREKELRLALVCYGGISLAVYMHGITKEVWRLARASRAFHADDTPASGSQGVYRALLQEIEDETGIRLRVLVDIIAGASAGGINGVFLAQAISTGQSLEPLTDLWFDFRRYRSAGRSETRSGAQILQDVGAAARMDGGTARCYRRDGGTRRARGSAGETVAFSSARGGSNHRSAASAFTGLILDALDAMAAAPSEPRLLPEGQPLDLFVTVTDFRGHPERLTINSPPEVVETEHRVVVPFSDHGVAGASLADPAELTFAAARDFQLSRCLPAVHGR